VSTPRSINQRRPSTRTPSILVGTERHQVPHGVEVPIFGGLDQECVLVLTLRQFLFYSKDLRVILGSFLS